MKRLTPGTVTIGVLAILFGLAAAYAARRYFDVPPEVAQPAPPPKTATVVLAKINLPMYSRIRDQDVTVRQVPIDRVPPGAVTSKSRALFRLVKGTIMADQPLMEANLFGVGEVPKLSDRLPPGHRAVTLSVSAESALNGMIQPESDVDITMTVKGDHPELGGLATLTLMRGVKVLATSQAFFPMTEDRAGNVRNITVSVTPEQANKLILAQRYGTLSVTLCSSEEPGETLLAAAAEGGDDGRHLVNWDTLLGLPPLPVAAEPTVIEKKAEVWRGGKRAEVTFAADEILEAINSTEVAEGREPMQVLPVSVQKACTKAAGKKGCKSCGKNKAADGKEAAARASAAGATQGGVTAPAPTLAPSAGNKTGRHDAAGSAGRGSGVAGQVLKIRVETEQIAPGS